MAVLVSLVITVPCTITIGHRASLSLCHPQRGGVGQGNVLYNAFTNESIGIDISAMLSIFTGFRLLFHGSPAMPQPWGGGPEHSYKFVVQVLRDAVDQGEDILYAWLLSLIYHRTPE